MSRLSRAHEALWRGDVYRVLALGLDYPSPENVRALPPLLDDLVSASRELGAPLPAELGAVAGAWAKEDAGRHQARYHALFDTGEAIGTCESAYRRMDRGAIQRDVTAFYAAFGFAPAPMSGQPDTIRHELGFLAYLAYKEWAGIERRWRDSADVTRAAAARFLGDHLGLWCDAFCRRLAAAAGESPYGAIAEALAEWVMLDSRLLGERPAEVAATG